MKKNGFLVLPLLLTVVCLLPLTGCGGGDGNGDSPPAPDDFTRCLGNSVDYGFSNKSLSTSQEPEPLSSRPHVAGEVLIKFAGDVTREKAANLVPKWGARIMSDRVVPGPVWGRWVKAALPSDSPMEKALADLAHMPEVEIVQPNYIYRIAAVPNDWDNYNLWGMDEMDMPAAWDTITDCSSVRVAVIDTGINYDHQDLAGNMWDGTGCPYGPGGCPKYGYDFVGAGDNNPMDMNGHGTHVAGIIGAVGNNGVGVTGACWRAEIVAVRTMQADGSGTSEDIAEGMRFAADAGARVINMSLGGSGRDDLLLEAAKYIQRHDAILVTAAGNTTTNTDEHFNHPGCFNLDNIINVAAVTEFGQLASFSNYGAVSVDLAGPGTSIWSPYAGLEESVPLGGEVNWQKSLNADWTFSNCALPGASRVLSNPSDFCSEGVYANDIDDRTWLPRDLSQFNSAYLLFDLNLEVAQGDTFRAAYSPGGGDPFTFGTTVFSLENTTSEGEFLLYGMSLDACTTASCSFGFQLETGPSGQANGVAIDNSSQDQQSMLLVGLKWQNNIYTDMQGTSMASPNVAGVAALLWARHPWASYRDIILAVFDGTTPLGGLSGKTCTGGQVNARNSLDILEARLP